MLEYSLIQPALCKGSTLFCKKNRSGANFIHNRTISPITYDWRHAQKLLPYHRPNSPIYAGYLRKSRTLTQVCFYLSLFGRDIL